MDFGNSTVLPTIYIVSDAVGITAQSIARAAAAQFGVRSPSVEVLPKARTIGQVVEFLEEHQQKQIERIGTGEMLVLYTVVSATLVADIRRYVPTQPQMHFFDLMGGLIDLLSQMSGLKPAWMPGVMREADRNYFKRIESIEFTIAHDDGMRPEDLTKADIVIVGVSRTSKTPVSIYLSQHGLKVANIPLDPQSQPPSQLFSVDARRIFGLMSDVSTLADIRRRRVGSAAAVAGSYADVEYVQQDLEDARKLMRRLGCIVVHTEGKAVEETAQEILTHYRRSFAVSQEDNGF